MLIDIGNPRRRNKIDYIAVNKTYTNAVLHSKTYPSVDYGSDSETLPVE